MVLSDSLLNVPQQISQAFVEKYKSSQVCCVRVRRSQNEFNLASQAIQITVA
jgi:hypothetical protein